MCKSLIVFIALLAATSAASIFADDVTATTAAAADTTLVPAEDTTATEATEATGTTAANDATTPVAGKCVFEKETWSDENLMKFHLCVDGKDVIQTCGEDEFFVNNATISGCVPMNQMQPECVNLDAEPQLCTEENYQQQQPSKSLNSFYLCTGVGIMPVLEVCPDQKVFLRNEAGWMGCFEWSMWRFLRGCPEGN